VSLLFGFSGRIDRTRFWLAVTVATAIYCAVAVLSIVYYSYAARLGADALLVTGLLFAIAGWFVPMAAAMSRRLHELDCSGAWTLLLIFFVVLAAAILGAIPGQPGPNRFGPDPLVPP